MNQNSPVRGSLEYALGCLQLIEMEKVYPHEATKKPQVFSLMASMNRIDPEIGKRMSPIPIMVRSYENPDSGSTEYVVLDGMHRYAAMSERGCQYAFCHVIDDADIQSGDCVLGGWHEIVSIPADGHTFLLDQVFEYALEDLSELVEGELAKCTAVIERIPFDTMGEAVEAMREATAPLPDGTFDRPFAVIDGSGGAWVLKKEDSTHFTLHEAIQAQIDFDEALETSLMENLQDHALSRLSFVSEFTSTSDFSSTLVSGARDSLLVIRPSFRPYDIVEVARQRILVPKKTTRHEFPIRIFVQIPVRFLDPGWMKLDERNKSMHAFISETYQPRFYPEPIFNFKDVIKASDVSSLRREDSQTQHLREILSGPLFRSWAHEWAPRDDYAVAVPGPVGFVDHSMALGLESYMVGHRSEDFSRLHNQVVDAVRWVLQPDGGDLHRNIFPYIIGAPASQAMAVAALAAVRPGKRILHIVAGAFGHRWKAITDSYDIDSQCVHVSPGHDISEDALTQINSLLSTGEYDAVSMIHNETSTGCLYDPKKVYRVVAEAEQGTNKDILFLVDACSSIGGLDISDIGLKDVDLLVLSTEKCLAVPPGISLLVGNSRAYLRASEIETKEKRRMGFMTSLTRIHEAWLNGQTVATPAIPQIYMTLTAFLNISGYITRDNRAIFGEGLHNRYHRYATLAELTRQWGARIGMQLFSENLSLASSTVTALRTEGIHPAIQARDVVGILSDEFGVELSAGHRHLVDETGKQIQLLRFAHMGAMTMQDQKDLLFKVTKAVALLLKDRRYLKEKCITDVDAKKCLEACDDASEFLMAD